MSMESGRRPCQSWAGWLALAAMLGMLAVSGCDKPASVVSAPPAVSVAHPLVKQITDWDEYTGRLGAVNSVEVRARVSGYLESSHFTEGGLVKTGDLLFVIDPRPYRAALTEAQAQYDRAQVQLDLAENDLKRAQGLFKSHAVSAEELDARTQGRRQAVASVEAARASVDVAQLNLEFTEVHAPISGRIGRKLVTEGNLVEGGSAHSTELTTIVSLDPIYAYFNADEQVYLDYIRSGARPHEDSGGGPTVQLQLGDETEYQHEGRLDFIDNRVDAGTDTMLGRALVPNPDMLLTPGLFARVRVQGRAPYEALLIPDAAVQTEQGQRFVYALGADRTVVRKPVETGRLIGELRVLQKGVVAGDEVVVQGMQRVKVGAKVTAEPVSLEQAEASPGQSPRP